MQKVVITLLSTALACAKDPSQQLFEKGKGMQLEKDLKVARMHVLVDMIDMEYVEYTFDCHLEGLWHGFQPYYELNGECVSYNELVEYFAELIAYEESVAVYERN